MQEPNRRHVYGPHSNTERALVRDSPRLLCMHYDTRIGIDDVVHSHQVVKTCFIHGRTASYANATQGAPQVLPPQPVRGGLHPAVNIPDSVPLDNTRDPRRNTMKYSCS